MFKNGQSILSFSNYIVSLINLVNAIIINFQLSMESHSNIFFHLKHTLSLENKGIKKVLLLLPLPLSQVANSKTTHAVSRLTLKR